MTVEEKRIVQIVPGLPPMINGVGDYAINLAEQLFKDFSIITEFVVANPDWSGETRVGIFPVHSVKERSRDCLLAALSKVAHPILLHYVGHGYERRGCAFWVIEGLECWRRSAGGGRLVTMYHEVYAAGGPPWSSCFWLSPFQKDLAARLYRLSDGCITNREEWREMLRQLVPHKVGNIIVMPVFSNFGEIDCPLPLQERSPNLVIFGSSKNRTCAYKDFWPSILMICQAFKIDQIIDIGEPTGLNLSKPSPVCVEERGVLRREEIVRILSSSRVAFLPFPPAAYLAKSSVFAAYCAHGLATVLPSGAGIDCDGLESGRHYLFVDDVQNRFSFDHGQKVADQAHAWYQEHCLQKQACVFASAINH